jgi:hypothetical protein
MYGEGDSRGEAGGYRGEKRKDNAQDLSRNEALEEVRRAAIAGGIPTRNRGVGKQEEVDELDQNENVYLTECWRTWECHYLRRLAKRIHRMVCTDLDRFEESLFMLFVQFDTNLDGTVDGEEVRPLMEAIEHAMPGSTRDTRGLVSRDGSIKFVQLLKWFKNTQQQLNPSMSFDTSSFIVSIMGSGAIASDSRADQLSWQELRHNVTGYRRLLGQVRELQEDRLLRPAREAERSDGLMAAMPMYYAALEKEFEGDYSLLFDLFHECDDSGNMMLETNEVEKLLQLFDTDATPEDLGRYITEINLADGPLTFASLLDWWDQARSVPNSLVAEKGSMLMARVKTRGYQRKLGSVMGIFSQEESAVVSAWNQAQEQNRIEELRENYERIFSEIREYKMERDLRLIEQECAQP